MSYEQEHSSNNSSEIQKNPNVFDHIKRAYKSTIDYIKERSSETGIRVIGTTAGIALAAAALSGCATGEAPVKTPTETSAPSETGTPSPEATQSPEAEYSVESLALPETLSAEEAARQLFGDRLNQSDNAGKSDEFKSGFEQAISSGNDAEIAYAQEAAAKNNEVFTDALFVPGWESNPDLVKVAEDQEKVNFATLSLWAWTYHPDPTDALDYPDDQEPYERSTTVDSVEIVSESETSTTMKVIVTMHDNRAMNSAPTLTDQPDPNGLQLEANVELQKVDGTWKVSQFTWTSL